MKLKKIISQNTIFGDSELVCLLALKYEWVISAQL